jgi:type IV pilus assembly protein PilX
MPRLRGRQQQRGAVLVIALIMLVLITVVAMSTIRSTTTDERIAGNVRDRERAFQAAEAVVQACLDAVQAGTYESGTVNGEILTPVLATDSPSTQNWDDINNWADTDANKKSVKISVKSDTYNLDSDPRCMVEKLSDTKKSFRVTGRAVGASPDSIVLLQATYSEE